ncbi:hypothetical protein GCM10010252_70730 [Streptomyces aureoverticillatus]|nr:hypothetical protein GCM10010252_70730 [Streptomyces aureoverticillatus]
MDGRRRGVGEAVDDEGVDEALSGEVTSHLGGGGGRLGRVTPVLSDAERLGIGADVR